MSCQRFHTIYQIDRPKHNIFADKTPSYHFKVEDRMAGGFILIFVLKKRQAGTIHINEMYVIIANLKKMEIL